MYTITPSLDKDKAQALPKPLEEAQIMAFFPAMCKSINVFLNLTSLF
jgi:hypothetical protein